MKAILVTTVGLAALTALAGCQTTTDINPQAAIPSNNRLSISEQIASATCTTTGNGIRRDRWLAADKPSWDEYVEGHTRATGQGPEGSSVAMAYKAYLDSGNNHVQASALFDQRHPDWRTTYPRRAKCWVQYEG